nr:hypothetical protein CFP56_62457 [Quercus suber]
MKSDFVIKIQPLLLAALASAYVYEPEGGLGDVAQPESYALFVAGNQNPNATNSVTFDLLSNSATTSMQLTWRVNVTDISVPNATVEFPGESPPIGDDPHITNLVYDFQWPGSDTLNQVFADSLDASSSNAVPLDIPLCIFVVRSNFPTSIADKYSPDDGASCDSTLGSQCVSAITSGISTNAVGCPSTAPFYSLVGCEDSFGMATDTGSFGFELANATADASDGSYVSGQGFYWEASGAHAGTNTTSYENEVSTLQMLIVTGPNSNQMFCQRIATQSSTTSTSSMVPSASTTPTGSTSSPSPTTGAAAGSRIGGSGVSAVGLLASIAALLMMGI